MKIASTLYILTKLLKSIILKIQGTLRVRDAMLKAQDIANYFLFKAEQDEELISNLKLQKLIYYAQGLHLAFNGSPLFNEKIKAWRYGPVVEELYFLYKRYGAGGIPADKSFKPKNIDKKTREFLGEVYTVFGQFSAMRLMDLTHIDQCWKDAQPNGIISHRAMQKALKKYIKDDKE